MSLNTNKKIIKDYIEKIINTGNFDKIGKYISQDYQEIYNNKITSTGIETVKKHLINIRQTYPDLKITIENQIAEGDWVATYIILRGTHTGLWMDIKPTGKTIEISGINLDKIKNGLIVKHIGVANTFEALLKIKAIHPVSN